MSEDTLPSVRRSIARSVVLIGILVGSYALLPFRGERWWLGATIGLVVLAATIPVMVHRLRLVLRSPRPALEAGAALAVLLVMLVVGFAALYLAMDRNRGQFAGLDTRIDAIYFTVTTLSTVGFGDITATGQAARVAVTAQILLNLSYVGVAVRVFITAAQRAGRSARPQRTEG